MNHGAYGRLLTASLKRKNIDINTVPELLGISLDKMQDLLEGRAFPTEESLLRTGELLDIPSTELMLAALSDKANFFRIRAAEIDAEIYALQQRTN